MNKRDESIAARKNRMPAGKNKDFLVIEQR